MLDQAQNLVANVSVTTDLVILAVVVLVIVFGLLLGQGKIKTLALSIYVGIVLANELSGTVDNYFSGFSEGTIKLALLALPIFVLELGRHHKARRGEHSGPIMTVVLGLLASCLIVASGLHVIGNETRQHIMGQSSLATLIYAARLWWIAGVPLAVMAESFVRLREH